MTLTQLGAFVLVARPGSVRAAPDVLGVSEPAVSRALAALRQHMDDQLVVRDGNVMILTPSSGVATSTEMRVPLPKRLADVALGPDLGPGYRA
jgi:Bacterial regulatory helix-turn-helix protein, lysR family